MCKFKRDTSKVYHSFATLPLSSTITDVPLADVVECSAVINILTSIRYLEIRNSWKYICNSIGKTANVLSFECLVLYGRCCELTDSLRDVLILGAVDQ